MRTVLVSASDDHVGAILAVEEQIEPGAWSPASVRRLLAAPTSVCLVAQDTRPRGHVLTSVAADEAEVITLAVAAEARRLGVGRALMHAVLAEWGRRQVRTAFLEVRDDNVPALALYRSLGFVEVGRRRGYYGDGTDALVMQLTLSG